MIKYSKVSQITILKIFIKEIFAIILILIEITIVQIINFSLKQKLKDIKLSKEITMKL